MIHWLYVCESCASTKYLHLPIDGGYDCGVDDVNEIAVFVQLKY